MYSQFIIDACVDENGCFVDHDNHHFEGLKSMAEQYGTNSHTVKERLKRGHDLKYALTGGVEVNREVVDTAIKVLGTYYPSYYKVAEVFDIHYHSLLQHKDSLDNYISSLMKYKYDGRVYRTITNVSLACGIPEPTIKKRLRKGMDFVEATTRELRKPSHCKQVEDHLGNTYDSISALLKTYKLTDTVYYKRIERGWSLEKVLTTPVRRLRNLKMVNKRA